MYTCRDKDIKSNNTTTATSNICIPCSPSTIFVWFCDLVYVMLMVVIVPKVMHKSKDTKILVEMVLTKDHLF